MFTATSGTPAGSPQHATVIPLESIRSYHAHIYFDGAEQRRTAETLREQIAQRFPVLLGGWHDRAIGPHARPMYQAAFAPDEFDRLVPWLMVNRRGLAILVHPNTGRPLDDHLHHATWMGEILAIRNLHYLPETEGPEAAIHPNTRPAVTP